MTSLVWKTFRLEGAHLKLTLLALADYANHKGGKIFPSITTLAGKLSCSESAARRSLHQLIKLGAVRVVANGNGGKPGMTRHYQVNIEGLEAGLYLRSEPARRVASTLGVEKPRRVASTRGLASTRETGSVHDTQYVINHQVLPIEAKKVVGGIPADFENLETVFPTEGQAWQ